MHQAHRLDAARLFEATAGNNRAAQQIYGARRFLFSAVADEGADDMPSRPAQAVVDNNDLAESTANNIRAFAFRFHTVKYPCAVTGAFREIKAAFRRDSGHIRPVPASFHFAVLRGCTSARFVRLVEIKKSLPYPSSESPRRSDCVGCA
jgi:hypothetical protein